MLKSAEVKAAPIVASGDSIFKPTVVLMCGRTVAFGAAFFIPILLARIFTPEQFGTYKQVFLIYATCYGVVQLGMAESLFYFMPRNRQNAGRYVLNSVIVLLLVGFSCLGLLVSLENRITVWLNNAYLATYIPLLGANLAFMIASAPLEIALVSNKRYRWAAFAYGSDVVRVLSYLIPILIWRDLHALLVGGLIFSVLRFCGALFYFQREFGSTLRPSWALLREQFGYALPFELAVLVETMQTNLHQYAVSHYFDAAAFAIYSVGCLQVPLIEFFASPAGNVMMVLMAEYRREDRTEAIISLWHETTRKLFLIFAPLTALLIAIAGNLIPFLFTDQYHASVPIFMVWITAVALAALQVDSVLRVFAETRFLFVLHFIRLVFVVALIYLLMPRLGVMGAVLATVLAGATAKAIGVWRIKHLMGVRIHRTLPWRDLARISGASLLACCGPMAVQSLHLPAFYALACSGLTYAAIYGALLLKWALLTSSEKASLWRWLRDHAPTSLSPRPIRTLSEG